MAPFTSFRVTPLPPSTLSASAPCPPAAARTPRRCPAPGSAAPSPRYPDSEAVTRTLGSARRSSGVRSGAPPGCSGRMLTNAPRRRASCASRSASASLVVHPADHHVLEGDALAERRRGLEHRLQLVLLFDRHDAQALRRRRRMQRNGEPELLRPPGEAPHPGQDAHGRDGDVPRADPEAVGCIEDRQRGVHRRPVEQRLPHAHEDDVGRQVRRIAKHDLPHLARDLEGGQVSPEAHPAGGAERALERAAGLRGDAKRPAAPGGDQDRLDRLAVGQPPEEFPGAIGRQLLDFRRQPGQRERGIQLGP